MSLYILGIFSYHELRNNGLEGYQPTKYSSRAELDSEESDTQSLCIKAVLVPLVNVCYLTKLLGLVPQITSSWESSQILK